MSAYGAQIDEYAAHLQHKGVWEAASNKLDQKRLVANMTSASKT